MTDKSRTEGRMKRYEAIITTRTTIVGRDYEEAKEALKTWLSENDQGWELQSFYLIEDPAW